MSVKRCLRKNLTRSGMRYQGASLSTVFSSAKTASKEHFRCDTCAEPERKENQPSPSEFCIPSFVKASLVSKTVSYV